MARLGDTALFIRGCSSWVDEGRTLWANQSAYRWLITDEQVTPYFGNVEIDRLTVPEGALAAWGTG